MIEGTGAQPSPKDDRDFQLAFLGAGEPVDWSQEFRLPEPPDSDQRGSDDCTCESTSYFHWQLTRKLFSVRSLFAYIALNWGAYLRDAPHRLHNFGQETFEESPDPNPKTMQNMRSKIGLNPADALDDKILTYWTTNGRNPDQLAQAIRDFKGAIIGLDLSSEGWADKTNPRPPKPGEDTAGHALYVFGYHLHDGKKCIIAKSSWCRNGHHEHHIKQDYFDSGSVFSEAFVLVPRSNMIQRYFVKKGGKVGVCVSVDGDGIFSDTIYWAKSEAMLNHLKIAYEIPDNAPTITYPQ